MGEILEESAFDVGPFSAELAASHSNLAVGTSLWFENDRVRVWEVRLDPGVRCPFHSHTNPYFWTCVGAGTGRQRSPDGTLKVRRYEEGDTQFSLHSAGQPMIHDLENLGDSVLRFVTVELIG